MWGGGGGYSCKASTHLVSDREPKLDWIEVRMEREEEHLGRQMEILYDYTIVSLPTIG